MTTEHAKNKVIKNTHARACALVRAKQVTRNIKIKKQQKLVCVRARARVRRAKRSQKRAETSHKERSNRSAAAGSSSLF